MNLNTYTVRSSSMPFRSSKCRPTTMSGICGVLRRMVNLGHALAEPIASTGALGSSFATTCFDARDPFRDEFRSSPSPFRQNEFGGTFGGPVVIPKLYHGAEPYVFLLCLRRCATSGGPESVCRPHRRGTLRDFSSSILNQNIYDPATTQPDPSNPGQFTRAQFGASSDSSSPNFNSACKNAAGCPNMIPSSRIDQTIVSFLSTTTAPPT